MNNSRGFGAVLRGLSPLFLGLGLAGCASPGIVLVSDNYNSSRVKRVALVVFDDFPGALGSGDIAAGTFEKYLLLAHYGLIERRQVSKLLEEQSLDISGIIDQAAIRSIGKVLGVDAVALGSLTDFSSPRDHTVMVDVPQEQSEPIYGRVVTVKHDGDTTVKTEQRIVTGYSVTQTGTSVVPETETVPAHVGMSVRLVDVKTGEVLWSASASSEGPNLSVATEEASSKLMRAVVQQLKKAPKKSP